MDLYKVSKINIMEIKMTNTQIYKYTNNNLLWRFS